MYTILYTLLLIQPPILSLPPSVSLYLSLCLCFCRSLSLYLFVSLCLSLSVSSSFSFFSLFHRTAEGVKYFKRNAKSTALKHFHYALEIDNMNVEALVARGAL